MWEIALTLMCQWIFTRCFIFCSWPKTVDNSSSNLNIFLPDITPGVAERMDIKIKQVSLSQGVHATTGGRERHLHLCSGGRLDELYRSQGGLNIQPAATSPGRNMHNLNFISFLGRPWDVLTMAPRMVYCSTINIS